MGTLTSTMYDFDEIFNTEDANWNAYYFLTGELTLEDIFERGDDAIFFPFNPTSYNKDEVQGVIDWFASQDLFEECIELKKIKEQLKLD